MHTRIAISLFSLLLCHAAAAGPNFVVVMTDDLDTGSFERLLNLGLLPNIDAALVQQGVSFSESFVTNAMCCPSRATFLTGRYTHNHGVYSNEPENGSVRVFDDADTLATWLDDAGYATGYVGKYLNNYGVFSSYLFDQATLDAARAFWQAEDPAGSARFEATYRPPGWDEWFGLLDGSTYCTHNYMVNANGTVLRFLDDGSIERLPLTGAGDLDGDPVTIRPPAGGTQRRQYQTDVLANFARQFIDARARDDEDFLLVVMPLAPHVEGCSGIDPDGPVYQDAGYADFFANTIRPAPRHQPYVPFFADLAAQALPLKPSFSEADIADKPLDMRFRLAPLDANTRAGLFAQYAGRLASLLAVDDLVGELVAALENGSLADDTYIVFTSDNGWHYGEHRLSEKAGAYEEAIRVPLVVRVPGQPAARDSDRIALNNDLAPTIADLAGVATGLAADGRSLAPLLADPQHAPWRNRFLVEHYLPRQYEGVAAFLSDYNLFAVRTSAGAATPDTLYVEHFLGLQTAAGYYLASGQTEPSGAHVADGTPVAAERYDLAADPWQLDNLLAPAARSLTVDLADLIACQAAGCAAVEDR